MSNADIFPLQYAIGQAELVRRFLDGRQPEQTGAGANAVIRAAIELGERLPDVWRQTFRSLDHVNEGWMTVQQYEDQRNAVRQLFAAVRQAMDDARLRRGGRPRTAALPAAAAADRPHRRHAPAGRALPRLAVLP